MNYKYEIGKDSDFGMVIIEIHRSNVVTETRKWPITYILNDTGTFYDSHSHSFQRTKKWVLQNHQELLL
jgi:hypothetical protein